MRRLIAALGLVLLLAVAGLAGFSWLNRQFSAPGPLMAATDYVVPHQRPWLLATMLQHDGIVRDARLFRIAVLLTRGEGALHSAEFALPAHVSINQLLRILRTAKPVLHKITFPEGLTAREIRAILDHAQAASGKTPAFGEGELFPDTYEFQRGTPRAAIVAMAKARMTQVLDQEWRDREAGLPLTSPRQALILASIVERETALPAERPHVASVFLNRLRLGMKLESDPTVIYGASGGYSKLGRPISRADLDQTTDYNTYIIRGLPPTPIGSPGRAAIHAVLHPLPSEDIYFVANGLGGHAFASTLNEHNKNVAKWRALGH